MTGVMNLALVVPAVLCLSAQPVEKSVVYQGMEWTESVPQEIFVDNPEAEPGKEQARLQLEADSIVREWWDESLRIPLVFSDYGAQEYRLGELTVDGENPLAEARSLGPAILDSLGLPQEAYRVTSVVWDGEAYTDEAGQSCRRALALGQKRLCDYKAVYRGEIMLPETETQEKTEEAAGPEQPVKPDDAERREEGRPWWRWIQSGVVLAVALGLIGLVTGLALMAVLLVYRRREKKFRQFKKN